MPNFLILNGHPEPDSLTSALADSYATAAQNGARVERIDLATLEFALVLRKRHATESLEPDLLRAQRAILQADHVVWMFPTWWSGPPSLVKGFCERVLTPGFAYRYRGRYETPERLLSGRSARCITSMDSPGWWYRFVQGRPLHRAFLQQTLGFAGFAPLRMTTLHEVRFMGAAERKAAVVRAAEDALSDLRHVERRTRPRLLALPAWAQALPSRARGAPEGERAQTQRRCVPTAAERVPSDT